MPNELKNKRIAIVSTVPLFIETHFRVYVEALIKSGAIVRVYTNCKYSELSILDSELDVQIVTIPIERNISILNDLLCVFKLSKKLSCFDPDIVHSVTPKGGLLGMSAAWLSGVPLRVHTYTGQVWANKKGLFKLLLKKMDKLIFFFSTQTYSDSFSQREFLIKNGIVDHSSKVINKGSFSGVDAQRFSLNNYTQKCLSELRASLGIEDNDKLVLFLGRVNYEKGVNILIEAITTLEDQSVKLLIVGPVEDVELIKESERISYVDYATNPEDYIAICDCLCLPSYREGFGTVVLEAASMKKITIGSNIYGLSDAIVDDTTGYLVPPGNVKELSNKIEYAFSDDFKTKKMEINAYNRVLKHFDSSVMKSKFIEEYLRLLNRK